MASSSRTNERKNKTERERIVVKRMALQVIQDILREKGVECGSKRWTEQFTLEQCLSMIESLKDSLVLHGGDVRDVTLPMAKNTSLRKNVRSLVVTISLTDVPL